MSNNKIWEAIAQSSSRDLFDFVLTMEAHFAFQQVASGAEDAPDIGGGELAAFLFEAAGDHLETSKPSLSEVKS